MNLFLKIFLWFLAAIALMVGVVLFLNWTTQSEPVVSRWQNSVRNQMNIFAATAAQISDNEGEAGLRTFIQRLGTVDTVSEVDLIRRDGTPIYSTLASPDNYRVLVDRTFASGTVELEAGNNSGVAARGLTLKNGEQLALVVRWERPRPTPFFGESRLRYLRYIGLLFTAIIVCWALARYLSSPIGKLRDAARKLAAGDLKTRVSPQLGRRHDELGLLAADFDLMAERIEALITSQERLTRDVSHELRSPLARMNLALEIAKQKSNGDARPLLDRIENESLRLNEMIGRILTLSKLESGSGDIELDDIDLTELVEDVVADAEFEAKAKNKGVKLEAVGCHVRGNESLLRSAVENVLRNAVRYTHENTTVDVRLEKRGDNAVIRVVDSGGGVPEAELANLFRPFYRVGEARERQTGGIGLGLAIAERAIQAHGGSIRAMNEGQGLAVEIALKCRSGASGNAS
jgi:two-component system sensor histidine kinase CpxA